jgi:hypothetical protein
MRSQLLAGGRSGGLKSDDVGFQVIQIHQQRWRREIALQPSHRGESISETSV